MPSHFQIGRVLGASGHAHGIDSGVLSNALRDGKWKIVAPDLRRGPDSWELYDLSQDIGEEKNLA